MDLFWVKLPKDVKVVLLEDSPMRIAWFQKRVPDLVVCKDVAAFKEYFTTGEKRCDFVFFDHDLGPGDNGQVAAQWFTDQYGASNKYALIHSWNWEGALKMSKIMNGVTWIPFGGFEVEVGN